MSTGAVAVVRELPPLNTRQKGFVAEYLRTKEVTKSYLKFYPDCSLDAAQSSAYRLLSDARVQSIVRDSGNRLLDGARLSLEEKRSFLHKVIHTDAGEVDGNHIICNGIKQTENGREYKMPDKLAALKLDAQLAGELKEQPAVVIQTSVDSLLSGLMGTGAAPVIDVASERLIETKDELADYL